MEKETEAFILGFVTSIAASVLSLYIFYNYIAKKAAEQAVEKVIRESREYRFLNKTLL